MAPSSREQRLGLGERGARRRIEEGELLGAAAPGGKIEGEGRQIGGEDFRPRKGLQRRRLRLVPQPVADAGLGAPGAAAALVGGGARHPHGFEPRHADIGLVARHAGEPAIDHDAHALDGDRGLGDRRRQHDLAAAGRGRRNGAILLVAGQRAVERDHVGRWLGAAFEQGFGAADFGGAGQEGEQRAGIGAHRAHDGVGELRLDRPRVAADIAGLDRKRAAFAGNHRRVAEQFGDARAVDGRRHDQDAQILAQALLHVAGQRQAEIGVERALVELVEDHG